MCVLPMFTKGGQHGYQHSSDHRPLSAASRRWRLVRPRALVLGVTVMPLHLRDCPSSRANSAIYGHRRQGRLRGRWWQASNRTHFSPPASADGRALGLDDNSARTTVVTLQSRLLRFARTSDGGIQGALVELTNTFAVGLPRNGWPRSSIVSR